MVAIDREESRTGQEDKREAQEGEIYPTVNGLDRIHNNPIWPKNSLRRCLCHRIRVVWTEHLSLSLDKISFLKKQLTNTI